LSFLHASDSRREPACDSPNNDPGYKIREISSMLIERWQTAYSPNKEISVDETFVPLKGRIKFMQYIPSKPINGE
jgi:hypothetical protein